MTEGKTRISAAERDTPRSAERPRVICHMMTSVDGRIVTEGWPLSMEGRRQYEQVHATYESDAWLCGRVTMEQHFAAGTRSDAEVERVHDGPARDAKESFAFFRRQLPSWGG